MSCFPCFPKKEEGNKNGHKGGRNCDDLPIANPKQFTPPLPPHNGDDNNKEDPYWLISDEENSSTKNFTFRDLATATKNFRQEYLLADGAYGKIYKGMLQGSGQVVAIRHLDRNGGWQGAPEFVMEVAKLNLLEHQNLVKLVGYCAEGDQRLLVYEYMPKGSLADNLFELSAGKKPLSWNARVKIASGIAAGLEYLHEKTYPPVIYGELKSSNILLEEDNTAHISKHGLVDLVHKGNKMNISPTIVIDIGYNAPEYERNGEFTTKTDVYSFGVVLLELISGRKAFDSTQPMEEQSLINWARPIFKDQARFHHLADPVLKNGFLDASLYQAVGIAAMCLQEEPLARPFISDISAALSFLEMALPKDSNPVMHLFQHEPHFSENEDEHNAKSPNDHHDDYDSSYTEDKHEITSPNGHCKDSESSKTEEEHEFTSLNINYQPRDTEDERDVATPNDHHEETESSDTEDKRDVMSPSDHHMERKSLNIEDEDQVMNLNDLCKDDSDSSSDYEYSNANNFDDSDSDFDSDSESNLGKKITAEGMNELKKLTWNSRRTRKREHLNTGQLKSKNCKSWRCKSGNNPNPKPGVKKSIDYDETSD